MKHFLFIILLSFICNNASPQVDSSNVSDSVQLVVNGISDNREQKKFKNLFDSLLYKVHPVYRFSDPVKVISTKRSWNGKEVYFYSILALLIFFALLKSGFSKYIRDVFRLFFRATLKQRQIKEQLMQSPLPSLLFNILFILSAAVFLAVIFQQFFPDKFLFSHWLMYCVAGLAIIYTVKFCTLKICGWLFGLSKATDDYIFIVFITNKILGILLLPFIILLIFTEGQINYVSFTLSIVIITGMLLYRYYLSYAAVKRQARLDFFHFIIYLAAFEIAPLVLINKVLFSYLA